MTNNTPSGAKSIAKVPNQKVSRRPKCFSFFFFFFRRASSSLHDSFMMVFAQNSSIFHWAVSAPAHRFFPGLKSHETLFRVWIRTGNSQRYKTLTDTPRISCVCVCVCVCHHFICSLILLYDHQMALISLTHLVFWITQSYLYIYNNRNDLPKTLQH